MCIAQTIVSVRIFEWELNKAFLFRNNGAKLKLVFTILYALNFNQVFQLYKSA